MEEKIFHMAGAKTPQEQTVASLRHAIREAGREPMQRDSYYNHLTAKKSGAPVKTTPRAAGELVCA